MAKIKKVLIAEMDSGLGPMVKKRLEKYLELKPQNIILASSGKEAMAQVENARENGINLAIIGFITEYSDLLDEQEIIDNLRMNVPGIVIISCTGRAMMGANTDIPRPTGYYRIERAVEGSFGRKRGIVALIREGAEESASGSKPGSGIFFSET